MSNNKNMKDFFSRWRYAFIYIFVVVLFAVVNYIVFLNNTSYYLISDQLNKNVARFDYLNEDSVLVSYQKGINDTIPLSMAEFGDKIKPYLVEVNSTANLISKVKVEIDYKEVRKDSLWEVATIKRTDSIERYKNKVLMPYRLRIDSLESYISIRDSIDMVIQRKYVELANLNYEYALKNLETQNYIIQHYGSFISSSLFEEAHNESAEWANLCDSVVKLEKSRIEMASQIREMVRLYHNNRIKSVSFWDFLYYSICVSTTVSFGDIIPNKGISRFWAIFELLLCIVLVAIILDDIKKARNKHDEDEHNKEK